MRLRIGCLPLLLAAVGCHDPKADRAIHDLALFNGCETVFLENVRPKELLAPLKRAFPMGKADKQNGSFYEK